jgi:hypothetical protein|eukprot:Tamp_21200.p1 GENE.Tamp_21200~~Tamp_21200.p1  ORF type:complete len:245 (-),score=58.24 Tamp_21200:250-984(-)
MSYYEEQGRPLLGNEATFAVVHARNIRTAFAHAGVGLLLILPTVIVWQAVPDPIDDKKANNNIFHFNFALAGLHLAGVFGTAVASFVIVIGVHFLSRELPLLNAAAWLWFTTALVLVIASFIEMISLLELGREPKLEKNLIYYRTYLLGPGFVVPDGLALICMGLSITLEMRRKAKDDSMASDLASLLPVWMGLVGIIVGVAFIALSMLPLYATEFLVARYAYAAWGILVGSFLLKHSKDLEGQ